MEGEVLNLFITKKTRFSITNKGRFEKDCFFRMLQEKLK